MNGTKERRLYTEMCIRDRRYAASWRATYTTASGTYDAVATYSALAEEAPARCV